MGFAIDPRTGYTAIQQDGVDAILYNSNGIYQGSPQVPVRQTVLQSPVDTSGFPSFLAATFAGLVVTTQNVSTGLNSLVATAAQGHNVQGAINVIGQSTTNLTWPACTASNTNYLPVLVANTGVLTPQTPVILAPIYQWGGTPAVTAGQYTFNIQQMTMYLGNGSTAPAVNHVIVGEVVAGASTITSTVAYALMGRYQSADTAFAANSTKTVFNHNLGVQYGVKLSAKAVCQTATNGWAIGEIAEEIFSTTTSAYITTVTGHSMDTRNTCSYATGTSGTQTIDKTTYSIVVINTVNFKLRMSTIRNW